MHTHPTTTATPHPLPSQGLAESSLEQSRGRIRSEKKRRGEETRERDREVLVEGGDNNNEKGTVEENIERTDPFPSSH